MVGNKGKQGDSLCSKHLQEELLICLPLCFGACLVNYLQITETVSVQEQVKGRRLNFLCLGFGVNKEVDKMKTHC